MRAGARCDLSAHPIMRDRRPHWLLALALAAGCTDSAPSTDASTADAPLADATDARVCDALAPDASPAMVNPLGLPSDLPASRVFPRPSTPPRHGRALCATPAAPRAEATA
ncbi:MAG: hypothetical protein U0326_20350 [Polyangiales bacterium]